MNTNAFARLIGKALPLLFISSLSAQLPNLINYQGRLSDSQGNTVNGNRTMAVRVYDSPAGGNMTYEENIGIVSVQNGLYNFSFGNSGNGILTSLTGNDFIALTINGTEESARTRLLAVPYALKSATSADAQSMLSSISTINSLADKIESLERDLVMTQLSSNSDGSRAL